MKAVGGLAGRAGLAGSIVVAGSPTALGGAFWGHGADGWAVSMPEPDGLALHTAIDTIRVIARSGAPVVGFGATAVMTGSGGDIEKTVDAVDALADAALGAEDVPF